MPSSVRPDTRAKLAAAVALAAALAGCATIGHHEPAPAGPRAEPPVATATSGWEQDPFDFPLEPLDDPVGPGDEDTVPAPHDDLARWFPEIDPVELERERWLAESRAPVYDFPVELNDRVLAWLDHYSDRHAESFLPGLARSGRYLSMLQDIFAEEGLPRDLVYMAHVESAYKTNAYSRAGAKGVFQFIASTGRRYGLRIDYWVDERSDPEKAARASAAYLNDLYAEFGDWYLALAGYNAGEGKIRRGLAQTGARDFWELAETRSIRRETKNYVPAILAAIIISKDPVKYGFAVVPDPAVEYDTIRVEDAVDLRVIARCAGADVETLQHLNPALRRLQTPPGAVTDVRVPKGSAAATLAALAEVPEDERVLYSRHVVRSGDTLWDVSRAYGVSVSWIQDANGMGRRTLLRVGQVLKIPTSAASSYIAAGGTDDGEPVLYRVHRGDTLSRIAQRYGTTPEAIAAANGIDVHRTIHPGQRLRIVSGEGYAASGTAADGRGTIHTVRRGDTLWEIARAYRSSVSEICSANRISPRSTLYPGTKLTIPQR